MTNPVPRPALRRSADAHVHPAAPGQAPVDRGAGHLRKVTETPPEEGHPGAPGAAEPSAAGQAQAVPAGKRRLTGSTSDTLRGSGKKAPRPAKEKSVEMTVKLPKSLRREFRAAMKSEKRDADQVLATLIRAWLDR